jgi:3-phenylpropionate/trans-cinnamate dioxygenase ferredoxin component
MSEFITVATLTQCRTGELFCVKVANTRILLANVDGVIYAIDEMCSHEDAPLSKGCLQGTWVKCSLHGSRFDVKTGSPLEEPATTPLKTYPVRLQGENIQVWL